MNKIVSLALAAATAVAAVPALAQSVQVSEDGSYRATVSYQDLNLASASGQRALHNRLKAAATTVCSGGDYQDLASMRAAELCRKSFMDAARPQIELASSTQNGGSIAIAASR
jgi:UrcA family protein